MQDVYGAYVVLCKQVAGAARGYAPDDPTSPLALLRADVPGTLRSTTKVGGRPLGGGSGEGVLRVVRVVGARAIDACVLGGQRGWV
eukprot:179745-Chlamydomonas_euryale.AAC.3